jgi:hypothetical protein
MTENRHRNEQSKHQNTLCLCMKVAQGILLKAVIKFGATGGKKEEQRGSIRAMYNICMCGQPWCNPLYN